MNTPIVIVFSLIVLAILAHMTGGLQQTLTLRPRASDPGKQDLEALHRNWLQALCAFQLVSVDLLVIAVLLYLLAFTDLVAQAQYVGYGLAVLFFLWGCAWLLQLLFLRSQAKEYLYLGHWVFWFACSGLMVYGAQNLQV